MRSERAPARLSLQELTDRDPLVCLAAARGLIEAGDAKVVEASVGLHAAMPVVEEAVRSIARAYPERSGQHMVRLLLASSVDGGSPCYRAAAAARYYFDPVHLAHGFDADLGRALYSGANMDVLRHCIIALGHMGAIGWSHTILDVLGTEGYSFQKLHGEVETGFLRQFVHASVNPAIRSAYFENSSIVDASRYLIRVLERTLSANSWSNGRLGAFRALAHCRAAHADELLRTWLTSEHRDIVELGLFALGSARISRSAATIAKMLDELDPDDPLCAAASEALGDLGNDVAIRALLRHEPGSAKAGGQVGCLAELPQESFDTATRFYLARADRNTRWKIIRAIGLRRAKAFGSEVETALQSSESLERGVAAHALARLAPGAHETRIRNAHGEVGATSERVFASLALVAADRTAWPDIERQLRTDLAVEAHLYQRALQTDVLQVLTSLEIEPAKSLARAWRPFFSPGAVGTWSALGEVTPSRGEPA